MSAMHTARSNMTGMNPNTSRISNADPLRDAHKQARNFKQNQCSGNGVRNLIAPVNGYRGALAAQGKEVKNHALDNRLALKEMQRKNELNQLELEEEANRKLSKMKQFQGVKSRVFGTSSNGNSNRSEMEYNNNEESNYSSGNPYEENNYSCSQTENESPRQGIPGLHSNFLKKKSGVYLQAEQMAKANLERQRRGEEVEESPRLRQMREDRRKAGIPAEKGELKPRENVDWRAKNKVETINMKAVVKEKKVDNGIHDSYGNVPAYLQNRKQKWAEEERIRVANAPDVDCPKGMVCMPEAERLATLEILDRSEQEAKTELFSLPLTVQTLAMNKRKNALEAKLREIEDAKRIFNRAKVFIAAE